MHMDMCPNRWGLREETLFRDLGFGFIFWAWLQQGGIHHIQRKCVGKMCFLLWTLQINLLVVLELPPLVYSYD